MNETSIPNETSKKTFVNPEISIMTLTTEPVANATLYPGSVTYPDEF